jgi:hypothetical protein
MNENLYEYDSLALITAMANRGWDAKTLAKFSGVHENTILRMTGEKIPRHLKPERVPLCRAIVSMKLAQALRIKARTLTPDLAEPMPKQGPPKPPTIMGKPPHMVPGDWRQKEDSLRRRRRLNELAEVE